MKYKTAFIAFMFLSILGYAYSDDIAVIVNPYSVLGPVSVAEATGIYTGNLAATSTGEQPIALDYQGDLAIRSYFYRWLIGEDVRRADAHWVKLLFSGQSIPPRRLASEKSVLRTVSKNPYAIGFIYATSVDPSVKVLFVLPIE